MRKEIRRLRRLRTATAFAVASAFASIAPPAIAATLSWNASPTDGNWVTTGAENNWSGGGGTYPGSLTDSTNTDTALFNVASSTTSISLNDPLYVQNISFDAAASPYTIGTTGGDALTLTGGGAISMLSTLTVNNVTETINAPLILGGNYSFLNNATGAGNSGDLLDIGGAITAGVSGTTTLTLGGGNMGSNLIAGVIGDGSAGGTLAITKSGNGRWVLSGANTYSGATLVSAGALQLLTSTALGNTSGITVSGGAQLELANNITISGITATISGSGDYDTDGALRSTGGGTTTWAGNVILGADASRFGVTATGGTLVISGVISSASGTSGPAIRVTNNGAVVEFSGANTYTGNTSIIVGTLEMGAAGTLPAATPVIFGNNSGQGYATLDLNGFNQTVGSIAPTGGDDITTTLTSASPATLTINGSGASTFGASGVGTITGAAAISLTGTGTLTLAGANTNSGGVSISAGTLDINNAVALGTGSFTIAGGTIDNTTAAGIVVTSISADDWNANFIFGGTQNLDLGAVPITLGTSVTVTTNAAATLTASSAIGDNANAYALTKTGPGTLALTAANTYTGVTTVNAGTLLLGAASGPAIAGNLVVTTAIPSVNSLAQLTASNQLPANSILTVGTTTGIGPSNSQFDLNGFNQTIGGLTFTPQTTTQIIEVTTGNGTLTLNGPLVIAGTTNNPLLISGAGPIDLAGHVQTISGTNTAKPTLTISTPLNDGGLTQTYAGTVVLTAGDSTYAGPTTISAGAMQIQNAGSLGQTSSVTVAGGAELQLYGNIVVSGIPITISGSGVDGSYGALKAVSSGTTTWAGNVILGADQTRIGVTDAGAGGTFNISGVITSGASTFGPAIRTSNLGATVEFSGANIYLGNTTIVAATLQLGASNALPATTTVNFGNAFAQSSAVLDLNGYNATVAAIALIGGDDVASNIISSSGSPTLTLVGPASATFGNATDGVITGSISLTKSGSGTQTLAGANPNTYTGATSVDGGTLALDASQFADSTDTTVGNIINSNSSLVLGGGTLSLKGRADGTASSLSGTYTSASTTINVASTTGLSPGQAVSDADIPAGAYVTNVVNATSFTISAPTTAAASDAALTVTPTTNTTVQSFNATTIAPGASSVVINGNSGSGGTTLNLGAITRQVGGVVDFTIPVSNAFVTTTTANANFTGGQQTILGGYATVGGSTWAVSASDGTNPGDITGLSAGGYATSFTAGQDIDAPAAAGIASSLTINSLRFNTSGTAFTATIGSGQTLTIATGGILATSNLGSGDGFTITGGSITSGNGSDLIVIMNNGTNDVISSVITNDGATPIGVTRAGSGAGIYVVSASNTYSGSTTLVSGLSVGQLSSSGPPGSPTAGPFGTGTLIFDGGEIRGSSGAVINLGNPVTLEADLTIPSGSNTNSLTFSGPVLLANGSRTLNSLSSGSVIVSGAIGDGGDGYGVTLASTDTGTIVFGGANTYSGPTTIQGGTLALSSTVTNNNLPNSRLILVGDTLADKAAILDATGITTAGGFVLQSGQTLAGFGTVKAPAAGVAVGSGSVITGGNGTSGLSTTGLLTTTGAQVWNAGGAYDWKLNLANPDAGASVTNAGGTLYTDKTGVNWDQLTMSTLSVTGAFTIQVIGINLATSTFNVNTAQQWVVANTPASGITTTGSFVLAPPLDFPANVGTFTASIDDTSDSGFDDVIVSYSPTPEPTSLALAALGAGGVLLRRKRRTARPA